MENHGSQVTSGPNLNQASGHEAGSQGPWDSGNGQASGRTGTMWWKSVLMTSVEESPVLAPALPGIRSPWDFPGCLLQPVAASQAVLALL